MMWNMSEDVVSGVLEILLGTRNIKKLLRYNYAERAWNVIGMYNVITNKKNYFKLLDK